MQAVRVKEADFIGKEAHLRHREAEPAAILCTLTVDDHTSASGIKRYPLGREPITLRDGTPLTDAKGRRSYVTSAGAGPSIGKYILLAYLPPEHAVEGSQELAVEYMTERFPVTVDVAGRSPSSIPTTRGSGPEMKILVCVKRVPLTGGKMVLTADEQALETRHLGFTISPHEECGVEEAIRLVEAHGGESVVLTLGPAEALEQLRDAMAMGMSRAIHLETDGGEFDPEATAAAIGDAIRADEAALRPGSTSSSSGTSPPTRAATRSGCGSRGRSGGPARRG